jgi:hypothetical protein
LQSTFSTAGATLPVHFALVILFYLFFLWGLANFLPRLVFLFFIIVLLFICAYKAWVISPPCPHPLALVILEMEVSRENYLLSLAWIILLISAS